MQKLPCFLFVLKRSYICYYIICMTTPLITKWAYNWKMLFNSDPSKLAQEVLFSRKKKTQIHPTISFNNIQVETASHHTHLGVLLDGELNFKQHIDTTILKINKGITVIKKIRDSLPRKSFMTIYKAFLRPPN